MKEILHSFLAFNINGFTHLSYMISQNWSLALLLIAAVMTSVLFVKDTIVMTTRDEQHII